jgi:hypothetical protein
MKSVRNQVAKQREVEENRVTVWKVTCAGNEGESGAPRDRSTQSTVEMETRDREGGMKDERRTMN